MTQNNPFYQQPQTQFQNQQMVDAMGNPITDHMGNPIATPAPTAYQQNATNPAPQQPIPQQPTPPVSELDKQFNELFGNYFNNSNPQQNNNPTYQQQNYQQQNPAFQQQVPAYQNQTPMQQQVPTSAQAQIPVQQQYQAPNQAQVPMQQQVPMQAQVPNQAQFSNQVQPPMPSQQGHTSANPDFYNQTNQYPSDTQPNNTAQQNPLDIANINSSMSSLVDKHNQITMERLKDHVMKAANIPSSSTGLVNDYLDKSINVNNGALINENDTAKAYNEAIFKLRSLSPALFDNNAHSSMPAFSANQGNNAAPVNGMIPVGGQGAAMMHNYLRTSANNMSSDDFRNMFNQTLRM